MKVRPFRDRDAPPVAHLVTEGTLGQWTYQPEQFRESDDPARIRLVAEREGGVVATAALRPFGSGAPDALRLDLAGEPGTFPALYLALLARVPTGFTQLLGVVREDWDGPMHFFHAAGFRNAWPSWGAHLDLTEFDPDRFAPLEECLYLAGYETERLESTAPEAEWIALHALHELGLRDMPRNPTTTPDLLTLEELREAASREGATFVTRFHGGIVASTRLGPEGPVVESEGTVTHPAHRSQGVATALKAHALGWARDRGHVRASAGGAVLNLPLLRVNARLGYVAEAMWVTWERILRPRTAPT